MGPSPSWTPLLNLRLMAHYLSLCIGNPHIQTSTYSGIVTITSQPNLVSSTPFPIEPQQCVAYLSCSNRKRTTSGRVSLNANILNRLWTRWRKLNRSTSEVNDGVNNQGTTAAQHVTNEVKKGSYLSYPTHKVFVKASKSVVDMAFKPISKGDRTIKSLLVSHRTKTYGLPKWCHLLVPMWWPRLWWWIHRRNLQDLW